MAQQTVSQVDRGANPWVVAQLVVAVAVLLLMMVFGLLMRAEQAQILALGPMWFYQLMTLHGVGMVGVAAIAGAAIMWHFLSQYVELSERILKTNLGLFLMGVAMLLGSVLIGRFHSAWTFLYPLPGKSMGMWSTGAAALFLAGLLVLGVGFLLLHLDVGRALMARYGSFGRVMGWPQLFGRDDGHAPPPTVVASGMVTVVNILGLVAGATILVMMLVNLYATGFAIDALLAKNLIYFFGHVFINATIYMAVIAVYELLPRYTQRPWKTSKVFLASWNASMVLVLIIYPHHLLMDFAMPKWMLAMGQIVGYLDTFPVLVVTAYGGLMIIYRSGIRWDVASRLLFLSLCGWAAGAIPAFIDGTIGVNYVMHNTMWVPGHFHTYLLLGVVAMLFGFTCYIGKTGRDGGNSVLDNAALAVFVIGGTGLVLGFLFSGKMSVARRYAGHLPEWVPLSRIAAVFAALVVVASAVFIVRFLLHLRAATRDAPRVTLAHGVP